VAIFAATASAEPVMVFKLGGDPHGRLREQIIQSLTAKPGYEAYPLPRYQRAAGKAGFRGSSAWGPAAAMVLGSKLGVAAFVQGGSVHGKFRVRILDNAGQELWHKELPLRRGLLSPDAARRLAAAIRAAASQSAPTAPIESPLPPRPHEVAQAASSGEASGPASPGAGTPAAGESDRPEASAHPGLGPAQAARESGATAQSSTEVSAAPEASSSSGPPVLTGWVGATTAWRNYCARPGVSSCGAYNGSGTHAAGSTVDFVSSVPYTGFLLESELMPFAKADNAARGLGLGGMFAEGFSLTQVTQTAATGSLPAQNATATDIEYQVSALWRWIFSSGVGGHELGYFGAEVGLGGKTFNVDPGAHVPLPSSHRSYPLLGLQGVLPIASWLRVGATASLLLSPRPSSDDVANYGTTVSSTGFAMEAAISGQIYKPLGYEARFRLLEFWDSISGTGLNWQSGGAAWETYSELAFLLTARF
jgi:hypothetical protein